MRTLRLLLEYDGREFHGWQFQPDQRTIQGTFTDALQRLLREPVKVIGASRTDSGVHALGQVASVSTSSALAPVAIRSALNHLLPPSVRVRSVEEAPLGFHARYWARAKRYAYFIWNHPVPPALLRGHSWHIPWPLDDHAISAAMRSLRGKQDFSAFCAASGTGRQPICTVYSVKLRRRAEVMALYLSADSFLHHMVRNIIGSLVEIGRGKHLPEWIGDLLASRDRRLAGPTAPAHGLVLLRVLYTRNFDCQEQSDPGRLSPSTRDG
jgi:tRNA pseudouridine38-40 synthase